MWEPGVQLWWLLGSQATPSEGLKGLTTSGSFWMVSLSVAFLKTLGVHTAGWPLSCDCLLSDPAPEVNTRLLPADHLTGQPSWPELHSRSPGSRSQGPGPQQSGKSAATHRNRS